MEPFSSTDHYVQRGGNASNNCSVLGILGANPSYFGILADTSDKQFILKDFKYYDIDVSAAIFEKDCDTPKSCIILTKETGLRTIIHHSKNFSEITCEQFLVSDFKSYSWIHFEGRNVNQVCKMISEIKKYNLKSVKKITISLEVEKNRKDIETLISQADVVFVSKDFAKSQKFDSMEETLAYVSSRAQSYCVVICPWGEKGATAIKEGQTYFSPSFPPEKVVDTLGAGDTFIASTIFALMSCQDINASIEFGCKMAGLRVGIRGWKLFKSVAQESDFIQQMKVKYDQVNNG